MAQKARERLLKSHVELLDALGSRVQVFQMRKSSLSVENALCVLPVLRGVHEADLAEIASGIDMTDHVIEGLALDNDQEWVYLNEKEILNEDSVRLKLVVRPKVAKKKRNGPVRAKSSPSIEIKPKRMDSMQEKQVEEKEDEEENDGDEIIVKNRCVTNFLVEKEMIFWLDERHGEFGSLKRNGNVQIILRTLKEPKHLVRRSNGMFYCVQNGILYRIGEKINEQLGFDMKNVKGICLTKEYLLYMNLMNTCELQIGRIDIKKEICQVLFSVQIDEYNGLPEQITINTMGILCIGWSHGYVSIYFPKFNVDNELWEYEKDAVKNVQIPVPSCRITSQCCYDDSFYIGFTHASDPLGCGGIAKVALNDKKVAITVDTQRILPVLAIAQSQQILYYCATRQGFQCDIFSMSLPAMVKPIHVNIKVIVRCRPLLEQEIDNGLHSVVSCQEKSVVIEPIHYYQKEPRQFTFDQVYDTGTTQQELFHTSIRPIVQHAIDGYKCTIFAYGQTGSGKTYSMQGHRDKCPGIMYQSVDMVFQALESCQSQIFISYVEIYNEELLDLLWQSQRRQEEKLRPRNTSSTTSKALQNAAKKRGVRMRYKHHYGDIELFENDEDQPPKLSIIAHSDNGVIIHGLQKIQVSSAKDAFKLLEIGFDCRQKSATQCNKESSRSHAIFTLYIKSFKDDNISRGELRLVDLSGSENYERAGYLKDRQVEAAIIGQGLLALGRVIKALVENWKHVPYRESKLTRILQDSFGGTSMTTLLLAIAPGQDALDETLSTLNYAKMAQQVINKPTKSHEVKTKTIVETLVEEPTVPVTTPWEAHIPIRRTPRRLVKPTTRSCNATMLEWCANLRHQKTNQLSKKAIKILQLIFHRYDGKDTGVLGKYEVRKLFTELLQRTKEEAPKELTYIEFQCIFLELLDNNPEIAQDIITKNGYTLNMERQRPAVDTIVGVRGLLNQKLSLRPASAPIRRPILPVPRPQTATTTIEA
ncbi:hypothetical protein THRCLA_05859 [Thraustotheca clavata]|uniref:Kinesin n=1 Tax=Thraustotheca clavata TaxID=74557 RepID=A0A1V9ZS22_9STRA|nr:hypothetical protein THRCLA_05859 [Thraustotheca clavata]